MAKVVHEIWEEDGPMGPLPSLVIAGPDGDLFRKGLTRNARLVRSFEAESHREAMTIYYVHNGWGEYKIDVAEEREPYADSWAERQKT